MPRRLTADQLDRLVENTVLVLRARPDLLEEWQTNLERLLRDAREAGLEDEAVFVAAVLTLLASPNDTLPTGTPYDSAWYSIQAGMKTGVVGPARDRAGMQLEDLLRTVSEAVLAVLTEMPDERKAVAAELDEIRASARSAGAEALAAWLDDVRVLLGGAPPDGFHTSHPEPYHAYWRALLDSLAAAPD